MNERAQEIMNNMTSFTKSTYHRSEVLPELLALQSELVKMTFNEDHADLANLRLWDVERHLEQLNEQRDGVATEELQRFESGCKEICNTIKAEISGNKGEAKAFQSLERIRCTNQILHNVELTTSDERTELDAVVLTSKGAFIVEVKNTARDGFIDEEGNYFRTGKYQRWDSNLAGKMDVKTRLLSNVIERAGFTNIPIMGIVVFTNYKIQIENCCKHLRTCFLSQLPYIIQNYSGADILNNEQIHAVQQAISAEQCKESYPLKIDIQQFKQDFAVLMATLEQAAIEESSPTCDQREQPEIIEQIEEFLVANIQEEPAIKQSAPELDTSEKATKTVRHSVFGSRCFKTVVSTAAAVAITIATTVITYKKFA